MSSSQHISVETVKSMALNKKISLVEHNFISLAEKMPFSDEYTQIYRDIWCDQRSPFIKEEVLRDDPQSRAYVTVPNTTWVFRSTPAMNADVLELLQTRPFIREEYGIALHDIITAARTGNTKITVPFDRDEDEEFSDEEEEFLDADEQVPSTSSEPTVGMRRSREEDSTDDREKKKQRLDDGEHGESSPQYANPFQGQEIDTKLKGYVVLGHRGIGELSECSSYIRPVTPTMLGKSIFLYYILLLRLQAKQPTILVRHPEKVTVFLQQGVFSVSMADFTSVAKLIPDNAWCLAARARIDHLQWKNQVVGIHQYVMKPFTLSELIVGQNRTLNVAENISEISLEKYRKWYTPSARTAYQYANNFDQYAAEVRQLLRQMTFTYVKRLTTIFPNLEATDEQLMHHFFFVTAEAGGDRSFANMDIASRDLCELLITQPLL
ncbi:hypothetical protein ARMSODRAFT_1016834 [Armillaria solidipes]|uniref:Uncharacterized protein n=1 Tax=Armillaria solidipes TaxID=1076256 RepID=A0A2H3BXY8_9AGAR|nr:hypothetical protein ARMSODRAFT_1016834 [Armillaria solidipes]